MGAGAVRPVQAHHCYVLSPMWVQWPLALLTLNVAPAATS